MYKFIIAVCLSLLFVQDEPKISWDLSYRLDWSDFRGTPRPQNNAVAVTASGITFAYSTKKTDTRLIDYRVEISADFYPEKSWCVRDRVNNNILNHERLHFDITELFARKFRKRVAETRFDLGINKQIEFIHEEINKELEEMQNKYDAETDHSQIIEKQQEWQTYIVEELNKLVRYSS
ncbi:DUF922 domain-containing protein [Flavobacteriaceae sp. LMIT009]